MTTFYYRRKGHKNLIQDVPFLGKQQYVFQFDAHELLGWARIWAKQSGEKVIVRQGNLVTSYSTI